MDAVAGKTHAEEEHRSLEQPTERLLGAAAALAGEQRRLPHTHSMARLSAPTAGWSTGVRAGATAPSGVTSTVTPAGTCSASQVRKAASTSSGRWSGTSRKATLSPAVAGTMVLMPGPP